MRWNESKLIDELISVDVFSFQRLMTMEEAFKRDKEETDRLLREQKLEYESKIVELQKQVMETSISQSMLSSILSSSGLVDSISFRPQVLPEDPDEFSCMSHYHCFIFLE